MKILYIITFFAILFVKLWKNGYTCRKKSWIFSFVNLTSLNFPAFKVNSWNESPRPRPVLPGLLSFFLISKVGIFCSLFWKFQLTVQRLNFGKSYFLCCLECSREHYTVECEPHSWNNFSIRTLLWKTRRGDDSLKMRNRKLNAHPF